MCTHGRSGLGRCIYGSVAEAVLAQSPVPVLLVRPTGPVAIPSPEAGPHRLLVPLDGSVFAEEALLGEGRASGARLIIIATHGGSGSRPAFLGSVAREVLQRGLLPLMLVRPASSHTDIPGGLTGRLGRPDTPSTLIRRSGERGQEAGRVSACVRRRGDDPLPSRSSSYP